MRLPAGSTLEYDQICDTEAGFDHCIVEVSANQGGTWNEIARFDQSSDPAWASGVADPTQYRHASLSLAAFNSQLVRVRFRLESDELIQYDGWYLDNVHINDASCTPVASVDFAPAALRFLPPHPNPGAGGTQRFAFTLPSRAGRVELGLYDAQGRELRLERLGALTAGEHAWEWNGRDGSGHAVHAGVYFARLDVDGQMRTQKVLRLAR